MRPSSFALLLPGLLLVGLFAHAGRAESVLQSKRLTVRGLHGAEPAVAIWTRPPAETDKLPIVIAFHGKSESLLGPQRGHAAWVERYGLGKAYEALLGGVLTPLAFGGLVRERELAGLNAELAARPFAGLVTVGVYTPDLLRARPEEVERYARWVALELLPQLRAQLPVASAVPRQAGVDGVSLGGMIALEVGLRFPEVFGAVGTMQPAIRGREAELATLAERARAVHAQRLRLLSSDGDPFLPAARALSQELRKRRIAHELVVYPGRHDYAFNRGPGSIELLHFHDHALR